MGIQNPTAQGWSTEIISTIKWIRTRRLSIKNSPSGGRIYGVGGVYRESKAKGRLAKRKIAIKCPGASFFFFLIRERVLY
jgi:hypothetical protein